ncbi:MAG: NAD(P)H-hydrate dehydratase [Burkholderiales bacterium]
MAELTHPEAHRRPQPVLGHRDQRPQPWPLHLTAAARQLEATHAATLPPHTLMRRAGLGVARLALAVMPHLRQAWVLAGPGNNGGDGFEAALHLQRWLAPAGVPVHVGFVGDAAGLPADAAAALVRAREAGVQITPGHDAPPGLGADALVIDALLGRGLSRPPEGALAAAIDALQRCPAPVLAVDLPSGLPADTGALSAHTPCVQARWTLALLSLPPGLFTAQGRDVAGDIWWDDLGVDVLVAPPAAWLASGPALAAAWQARRHAQHKGSFGDVWVVSGAPTMQGAAVLASRAALAAGAGRVYLATLNPAAAGDPLHPELMTADQPLLLGQPERLAQGTVVAGCGGGAAIADALPSLMAHAGRLVLDADALNAVAADASLQAALRRRADAALTTVLTPHPLEAARLLGQTAQAVQADRLQAAQTLAESYRAVVVLKGSGSVVASRGETPWILPVGNAALATPGSGDVLAGWLGGLWSQGAQAATAARSAVWLHGRTAERLRPSGLALAASALVEALQGQGPSR